MKHSRDHILTSHAGSLPRPDDVIEANRARESGQASDKRRFQAQLRSSVADVVRRQKDLGIAIPGDGEFPDGKLILPGVVSHATNVVEHPELVAERITRFTDLVGKERVIASTDCGLGGRVHPQIAWAKLESLAHGAALATRRLR